MHLRAPAIVCSSRPHGETGAVVRLLSAEQGMIAAYVAGARGRQLRPLLIPGNVVEAEFRLRSEAQMPSVRLELLVSRGPWLGEPLAAAAIGWASALATAALPERHPYPAIHAALGGLLDAVCHAPSARGWLPGLLRYEALVLRELGYGTLAAPEGEADAAGHFAQFDRQGEVLERYVLAERRGDVMGARTLLRERLARMI
ncbi:MAG: recombination protein O N-terminal domain-containing protein [Novosphingobium sp.]|uniref:DNA repair protein RecO n=1 Tax=Novosphingobium sp. TaxID=1874826 RepID=UPI001D36C665|nr:recombination protein O N-terminal domain-containing protein [Novosphingobium sp.]MCB2056633.1 recombination protein O N-terminal domain-containing protein [Novosphingobium sp.]MCP5385424.1 recombination protein O N-terminal domain-containing protein [Novosphingobium sp.]